MKVTFEVDWEESEEETKRKVIEKLAILFSKDMKEDVKNVVGVIIRDKAQTTIDQLVQNILTEPFQVTNNYGEKIGKTMTFSDSVRSYFERFVDGDYRWRVNGQKMTWIQDQMYRVINNELDKTLKETVEEMKKQVKLMFDQELSTAVMSSLQERFGKS